jgi:predicted alpha/beta superfamily hydrolase
MELKKEISRDGNVILVTFDFHIPQLDRNRRIWVCLPKDYYTSDKTYPVIYMHDAQNLFDPTQNEFGTEWEVDQSLSSLQEYGDFGVIVVGIDHAGKQRVDEFSPWVGKKHGGGDGERYTNFIANTLKPYIDYYFRTKSGREHTGMIGSSMGGFITLYAGLKYQNVFSKLGIFSPSLWFSDEIFTFVEQRKMQQDMKIYMMGGKKEGAAMIPNIERMADTLVKNGFDINKIKLAIRDDGEHSEKFWCREFPEAYLWLFESINAQIDDASYQLIVFPNPADDFVHVTMSSFVKSGQIDIFDQFGKIRLSKPYDPRIPINISSLPSGKYQLRLNKEGRHWFKIFTKN